MVSGPLGGCHSLIFPSATISSLALPHVDIRYAAWEQRKSHVRTAFHAARIAFALEIV
jgi:hypothetical protein